MIEQNMFNFTKVKHDVPVVHKACLCCKQESHIAVHRSTCLRCIKHVSKQGFSLNTLTVKPKQ